MRSRPAARSTVDNRRPIGLAAMSAGLLLGLGAALSWGLVDVCAAIAGRRLGSLKVLAIAQIASLVVLAIAGIVTSVGYPRDVAVIVAAGAAGIGAAGAYLSFF